VDFLIQARRIYGVGETGLGGVKREEAEGASEGRGVYRVHNSMSAVLFLLCGVYIAKLGTRSDEAIKQ
jgi:hypothetical protein